MRSKVRQRCSRKSEDIEVIAEEVKLPKLDRTTLRIEGKQVYLSDDEDSLDSLEELAASEYDSDSDEYGSDTEQEGGKSPAKTVDTESELGKNIDGMKIKSPNFFQSRLEEYDEPLFIKNLEGSDSQRYGLYSRMCGASVRRQPVILNDEEMEKIITEYPDSYSNPGDIIDADGNVKEVKTKNHPRHPKL